ncbi:MAG: hypothetical protein B6U69_03280 [Thermofilum sp. ex4484_15]|nr:MAG: hypothetical protein B6U69_03280 [Thermofilum sp. ex4484_15]
MNAYYPNELSAKVYWCPILNVPVFDKDYPRRGEAIAIKATPPRDLRPAFGFDYLLTRRLLAEYFLSENELNKLLPPDKLILLNKIPYPDAADEIIIGGQVIGHRFFDLKDYKWRFKPMYGGVAKVLSEKIGYYAVVNLPKITRGYVIHRGDIVESELPGKGNYVALGTINGVFQGVGKVLRGGRVKVVKVWRSIKFVEYGKLPTWKDVVKVNEEWMKNREEEAVNFLKEIYSRGNYGSRVFVSFSGGKDSLVCHYIAERALGDLPLLFNDTGIEAPHTVKYVRELADEEGVRLIIAGCDNRFFRALKVFGPPARDYRWCCKVVKLAPIVDKLRSIYRGGKSLSIVGQRMYESLSRARSPKVWINPWMPNLISVSPIQDWSSLEVWIYLSVVKAKLNPLYFMGFDRIGCWLCPSCELAEYEIVRRIYPELWEMWENYLSKWAKGRGLPTSWIRYGLWRWRKIPGDQTRLVGKDEVKEIEDRDEREIKVVIHVNVSSEDIRGLIVADKLKEHLPNVIKLLPIMGKVIEIKRDIVKFKAGNSIVTLSSDGDLKITNGYELARIRDLAKLLVRALYCVKCNLCYNKCPNGAILMDENGGLKVDGDKCSHCLLCNDICPLVKYSKLEVHLSTITSSNRTNK